MNARTLLLAVLLAGCSQAPAPAELQDAGSDARPDGGVPPTPAQLAMSADPDTPAPRTQASTGAAIDSLDLDFRESAADYMRRHAHPVPAALRAAAARHAQASAKDLDCATWPEGDRVFLVDLDGDGRDEGVAIHTLESCGGGGNNYVRNLSLLRSADGQDWQAVFDAPLGAKIPGNRDITRIDGGTLTLAGGDEPFDSPEPPESIRLPTAPAP